MRYVSALLLLVCGLALAHAQVPVCRLVTEPTVKCNVVGPVWSYEAKLPSWFAPSGTPAKIMSFRMWSEVGAGGDYPSGTYGQFAVGIDPGQRYAKAAKYPPLQIVNPTYTQGLGALRIAPGQPTLYSAEFPTPYRFAQGDGIAVALTCNGTAFDLQLSWSICANMPSFPTQCPDTTSLMLNGDSAGVVDSSGRAYVMQEQVGAGLGTLPVDSSTGQSAIFFDGNSYIRTASNGSVTTDFQWNTPRTLQTWIYPTDVSIDTSFRHIASGGVGSTAFAITILNTNKVAIGNENAIIKQSSAVCALNFWCHVAWVYDTVNSCLYVNGASQGCVSDTTPYNTSAAYIGRYGGALQGRFKGYMQNFRLDIGTLYTTGFTPSHTDPDFGGPRC